MAWTLTQLEIIEKLTALEGAIAQGALSVQYKDNKVTYRSLAEMFALLRMLRRAAGLDGDGMRDVHVTTDKALP